MESSRKIVKAKNSKQESNENLTLLPKDIMFQICSYLPDAALIALRKTSKNFKELVGQFIFQPKNIVQILSNNHFKKADQFIRCYQTQKSFQHLSKIEPQLLTPQEFICLIWTIEDINKLNIESIKNFIEKNKHTLNEQTLISLQSTYLALSRVKALDENEKLSIDKELTSSLEKSATIHLNLSGAKLCKFDPRIDNLRGPQGQDLEIAEIDALHRQGYQDIQIVNLSNINLAKADLENSHLDLVNLEGTNLSGTNLKKC